MRNKRRSFTLIEVIIAGALAAMLLGTVTQLYYLLETQARMARELRGDLFQRRFLQFRLTSLFASTVGVKQEQQVLFFSSRGGSSVAVGDSLVFVPDRGIDLKPEFSNHLLARLYRDEKNRLCLAYWPLPERWEEGGVPPMQREILMEDVTALSFSFYSPPTDDQLSQGKKNEITTGLTQIDPPSDSWLDYWEPAYQQVPPLVKVHITYQKREHTIVAAIPSGTKKIIYNP
jgi:hypothetical protein